VKLKICSLTSFLILCYIHIMAQSNLPPITDGTKYNNAEKLALTQINALYEVKDFMRSASKDEPRLMVAGEPDSTSKYYWIKLGISNNGMFRTSDDFFVNPKTHNIYLWDQMDNSGEVPFHLVSLQRWRHWRHDRRYWNFHTFKDNKLVVLDFNGKEMHGTNKNSKPVQKKK